METADCGAGVVRDLAFLFIHLMTAIPKLISPGGSRVAIAGSIPVKHQLIQPLRSIAP